MHNLKKKNKQKRNQEVSVAQKVQHKHTEKLGNQ